MARGTSGCSLRRGDGGLSSDGSRPAVSLTIPAHNEAANIASVVTGARDVLAQRSSRYEIVLVDDGSTDGTAQLARAALGDDAPHLTVVRHERKRGYAATVCDGLRASGGRLLAFMDGDRQFDPADLGALLDRTGEADLVAGYRARRADPWYRSVISGVLNLLVRLLYGVRRRDVDCGLKVFSHELFTAVSPLLATSALFNTELYFKAQRLGFRVEQVPVRHLPRVAGRRSGARLIPILRALRDLVVLRVRLARDWSPSVPAPPAPEPHARDWLWALPALALFAALRLPSFWEPHWYTDEAGYVSTAQSLLHGSVLYSQIWTNKPPLMVWTVAAVVHLFGPSEAALHGLTAASGLLTLAAIFWAGRRVLGTRRGALAALLAAIPLGLPVLDAELSLPESLLIAPVTWAGAIIAVHLVDRGRGARGGLAPRVWPLAAGALVAAAIAYQQSALAETLAFTIALAVSPRIRRREVATFLLTIGVITGAWVAVVIAMAGAGTVGYALVGFYIAFTQSVLPADSGGQLAHFAEAVVAGVLFVGGAILRRRSDSPAWFFVLWAGASLLVAAVSGQPYAHYLTPAVAPVALALASTRVSLARMPRAARLRSIIRVAPQLAGVAVAGVMASNAGLDWLSSATPSAVLNDQPLNASRDLALYYGGAVATAAGAQARDDWSAQFDSRVPADAASATYIKQEGLSGATAVVWSSDAWVYPLAGLINMMPTPPIYNDEVLLGINGQVAAYVAGLRPVVIVTSVDALQQFPEIMPVLTARYVQSFSSLPDAVWVRADVASQLP